jgi:hypothetical protein
MSDNIIDFEKLRKDRAEKDGAQQQAVAIVHDRAAYVLRKDGMMEIIEGRNMVVQEPTNPERQMIVQIQHMEQVIAELIHKYEPHRIWDDYLCYVYFDWDKVARNTGGQELVWHTNFMDAPEVLIQRAVWPILVAVREYAESMGMRAKIGGMAQEPGEMFKLLSSDCSPFVFRIDAPEDVMGTRLKAKFIRKPGRGNKSDPILGGELEIPHFWSDQERTICLARILTCDSSDTIIHTVNDYIKIAKAGYIHTQSILDL